MSKLDHHGKCPECGTSWDGGPIPEEDRDFYSPPYRWSRLLGQEVPELYDGISFWHCPDCKAVWDRWTGKLVKDKDGKEVRQDNSN